MLTGSVIEQKSTFWTRNLVQSSSNVYLKKDLISLVNHEAHHCHSLCTIGKCCNMFIHNSSELMHSDEIEPGFMFQNLLPTVGKLSPFNSL